MQNFLSLKEIVERIEKLPPDLRRKAKKKLLVLSRTKTVNAIRNDFLTFVKHMWPDFIEGSHHKIIAKKFNKLASGEIKRLHREYATPSYQIRICILSLASLDDWQDT